MMMDFHCDSLQLNFLAGQSDQLEAKVQVKPDFSASPWYAKIIFVLQNLQPPAGLRKTISRSVKLKAAKFCIIEQYLYWKDLGGILLNCLLENEAQHMTKEFHEGDCGGHHSWKVTANKNMRAGFHWHLLFSYVYKETTRCHQCQIFYGKMKVVSLPQPYISRSTFPAMRVGFHWGNKSQLLKTT